MNTGRPSYLRLCPAEPFRIFFPLGTLLGISGVSLWPLFFSGLHKFYPGIMHARMMIEGFLGAFVIGFLGTAMPRLLGARPLRGIELWPLIALHLLAAGLHIGHQTRTGDAVFVVELLAFVGCMAARIRREMDLPPPAFVLVAFGLLSGIAGPVLGAAGTAGWLGGRTLMFGTILLHQGFVLFLLLGVGAFLLPRFLGVRDLRPLDEERRVSGAWLGRACFAGTTGAILMASFWIEAENPVAPLAAWLRTGAAVIFLGVMIPFHRQTRPGRTVSIAAQGSLLALIVGLAFPLWWPGQRVAGMHVVFLGGFSLITFTVATRVVLGHSGRGTLFATRLPSLQAVTALLLAAAILRATGDFLPSRSHWLDAASYAWMLAAGIWGAAILPGVRHPDPDDHRGPRRGENPPSAA